MLKYFNVYELTLFLLGAKKFKEIFEKSQKDVESIIGKKETDSKDDESDCLADELDKLKVATSKDGDDSEKTLNGLGDEKSKEDNKTAVLEGKESED